GTPRRSREGRAAGQNRTAPGRLARWLKTPEAFGASLTRLRGCMVDLSPESVREDLVNQLRAQKRRRDVAGEGGQFNDIAADDGPLFDHVPEQLQQLVPREPARFRGSGCRHDRRVQSVDVNRDVDRIAE